MTTLLALIVLSSLSSLSSLAKATLTAFAITSDDRTRRLIAITKANRHDDCDASGC